jgi:cytosine/adenosine deaminase-related metal-dependent hydrolase
MAGHVPPQKNFADWIKALVALKASWNAAEFAQSWLTGAQMLLRHGVTAVADVEAIPELIPGLWHRTPLRVISFRELISLKGSELARQTVEHAVQAWEALPGAWRRVGLSPHAPYSTSRALLQAAARAARQRRWRLTTHVAESDDEYQMFVHRRGPLFDWLKTQRDVSDCGQGSPVQHLARCDYLGEDLLAVHANYLADDDFALLARHRASVVHCPRSHEYFQHQPFASSRLIRAGVNVCLGTDSLVTVRNPRQERIELDLFVEMQTLARRSPELTSDEMLRMATINGARALGHAGEIGEISVGARADLIALPFSGPIANAPEAAVHHTGPVSASMIGGQWAIAPDQA